MPLIDRWMQALGWALLHSLWQFALLGVVTMLLLHIFRRYGPGLRHHILAASLLLSLVAFTLTLLQHMRPAAPAQGDTSALVANGIVFDNQEITSILERPAPPLQKLQNWLNAHIFWLAMLWLPGVMIGVARFGASYLLLHYLRHIGNERAAADWQQRLQQLQDQMGVSKAVQLLESALVQAPMTFGHVKPVILVPLGLLTALPPAQVEALLLHELAHIRRHDFLVNLLLGILETLFFYHPVIWWLGARLREAREECCDDMVVAQGTARVTYAESLLAISQTSNIRFVMNANNHGSHFSVRIRRLLLPETPAQLPRPAVSALIAILFIITSAFGSLMAQEELVVSVAADKMNVLYIGVDNPITVAVSGIADKEIQVRSDEVRVLPQGEGKYIVQAERPGTASLRVESKGKLLQESVFRVKRIPDPVVLINGKEQRKMSAEDFKSLELKALLENFDFDAMCTIEQFTLVRVPFRENAIEVVNKGAALKTDAVHLIQAASIGDLYLFHSIEARCPGDTDRRKLKSLTIEIK